MHKPFIATENGSKLDPDILAAFVRLWAFLQVYSAGLGIHADAATRVLVVLTLAAAWHPSVPAVTLAFLASVVRYVVHMPYLPNGDWWGCLWDLSGFLLFGGSWAARRQCLQAIEPDLDSSRKILMEEYATLARAQVIIIWAGIACWKANTSFLDYRISCAPIVFLKVVLLNWCPEAFLGLLGGAEKVAFLLVRISPGLTLAVEGAIPMLLCRPGHSRCLGVALALALHLALGPWAAGFSNKSVTRYFLFVPQTATHALSEMWTCLSQVINCSRCDKAWKYLSASAWVLLCTAFTTWHYVTVRSPFDSMAVFFYIFLALILLRALYLETSNKFGPHTQQTPTRKDVFLQVVRLIMLSITFAYSLLFPMMGIQDMGVPNMFSNIALHGGSNHLFLPSGLLPTFFNDANPAHGNPFAGGIVRVDFTNSSILNQLYPAELTLLSETRRLLRTSGHIGRQWGPDGIAWAGPDVLEGVQMPAEFVQYTLPALEFRRGLELARAQNEPFFLEYTRLRAEAWGPHKNASMEGVRIYYHEDCQQERMCVKKVTQEICHEEELVLLPPPWVSWAGWLVLKFSLSNAYAVLHGYEKEVLCNAS